MINLPSFKILNSLDPGHYAIVSLRFQSVQLARMWLARLPGSLERCLKGHLTSHPVARRAWRAWSCTSYCSRKRSLRHCRGSQPPSLASLHLSLSLSLSLALFRSPSRFLTLRPSLASPLPSQLCALAAGGDRLAPDPRHVLCVLPPDPRPPTPDPPSFALIS